MKKFNNSITKNLFRAILALKNINEANNFFRDLLTEQEIIEFGKRWQAAQMLNARTVYSSIEKKTGLSSRTIARISRWLNKGAGGYRLILQRLNSHHHNYPSSEKGLC